MFVCVCILCKGQDWSEETVEHRAHNTRHPNKMAASRWMISEFGYFLRIKEMAGERSRALGCQYDDV